MAKKFWEDEIEEVSSSTDYNILLKALEEVKNDKPFTNLENRSGYSAYLKISDNIPLFSSNGQVNQKEIDRRIAVSEICKKLVTDGIMEQWFHTVTSAVSDTVLRSFDNENKWQFETLLKLYNITLIEALKCGYDEGYIMVKFLDKAKQFKNNKGV